MCGIAGIVTRQGSQAPLPHLQKLAAALAHRGPEQEGSWINKDGSVAFGHRRLCIIDLSSAASQPMHYNNRYIIVYNGEIYNYLELKQDLQKAGQVFESASDTEVVVAAYALWGEACLQRFDGAFAFSIWDQDEQVLFAARDRFGEKPFFFSYDGEQLVFASEIKAFWEVGIERQVNKSLLYNFLTLGYTTNPADNTETFYNNIQKLPAAHYLRYRQANNELRTHHYWQLYIDENKTIKEEDAIVQFRELFRNSVRKRLRSDVAIGTSLSGGLDSSAIVAFCAGEQATHYTHQCFTASFSDFEKDETRYAEMVARQYNLEHFTTTIAENDVPLLMQKIAASQDEPFSSASVLAQYKVFELAKQRGVTVLLDGQGADEILGGYHRYYKWWWQELYRARQLQRSGELNAARRLGITEGFSWKNKAAALLPELTTSVLQSQKSKKAFQHPDLARDFAFSHKRDSYYTTPTHHTLNGALYYNTAVNGLEELLRFADRNSMAHAVEVRLPFLQHELVTFLFTLPPHFKIHQGWTKWLLRKTAEDKLPREIVWRNEKIGYEPPQKKWMANKQVQESMREAKRKLATEGILGAQAAERATVPKAAHEENSFDWRYWSAAYLFGKE
jgi:asparagine synthase (glutamine-hydrolysing)